MQDTPSGPPIGASVPPAPAAPPARPTGPEHRLEHDGRFGEIFVLFLINLLFTVLTLGIYRFWGKTRIRRYVWSRTSLTGERFEYTGTGLELFLGFLIAIAILLPPIVGVYIWAFRKPPEPGDLQMVYLLVVVIYGLVFLSMLVYYVALFAVYRYRISRTSWYGIRGAMEGSAWAYGFLGLGLGLLNGLSLGWTKPWADIVVFQYRLKRAYFGDNALASEVRVKGLYGPFAAAWCITAVVAIIATAIVMVFLVPLFQKMGRGTMPSADEMLMMELLPYVIYVAFAIAWVMSSAWYRAALLRNIAAGTTIGPDRVHARADFSGGDYFRLAVPNFFLLIVSLGLLFPLVILRTTRFIARHVTMVGPIDPARIGQSPYKGPRVGEGLAEFLGVGMI